MDKKFMQLMKNINKQLRQTEDSAYQEQWIRTCAEKHFPPVVIAEVKKLLCINSKDDISRALMTLYHLRDEGVRAVWNQIKSKVILHAQRQCGTIFPMERIEEGIKTPLDIEYLGLFLANQIITFDAKRDGCEQITTAINLSVIAKNNQEIDLAKVYDYLLSYPVIETKIEQKEILEPTAGERLMQLADTIGQLTQHTSELMSHLVDEPTSTLFRSPTYPGLFSKTQPTLGCEPPPGSVIDNLGRTIVPMAKTT